MKNRTKFPTFSAVESAVRRDQVSPTFIGPGWCLNCGKRVTGVEPDAHEYTCPKCGQNEVYGAEEIAIMGCYR